MAMKEIKEEKAAAVDTLTTEAEAEKKDDFAPIGGHDNHYSDII